MHEKQKQAPNSIEDTLSEFAQTNPCAPDQLIELLHFVQRRHGRIAEHMIASLANHLNLSRAEVFGVISFYDDFNKDRHAPSVRICGAEACQALGSKNLDTAIRQHVAADVEVQEVFCLGNCATGPSAQVGNTIISRATPEIIMAALEQAQS